jgi:hypothetical protein
MISFYSKPVLKFALILLRFRQCMRLSGPQNEARCPQSPLSNNGKEKKISEANRI